MPYEVKVLKHPQNLVVALETFEHFPDSKQAERLASAQGRYIVSYDGLEIARMRNRDTFQSYLTCISCVEHALL